MGIYAVAPSAYAYGDILQLSGTITKRDIPKMDSLLLESWTLYGLGVIVVIARLVTRYRLVGFRGAKPDDYLMILAMVRCTFVPFFALIFFFLTR